MRVTFFYFFAEDLLGLCILVDGPGSHVEQVVVALGELVVEQADSLVDVVGLELSHHVGTRNRAVDVRYDHLGVLLPQENLKLSLFEHPRAHLLPSISCAAAARGRESCGSG